MHLAENAYFIKTDKYMKYKPGFMDEEEFLTFLDGIQEILQNNKEEILETIIEKENEGVTINFPEIIFNLALRYAVPKRYRKYFSYGGKNGEELVFAMNYIGDQTPFEPIKFDLKCTSGSNPVESSIT